MLGKAIRKAVLPILLASLMGGTGCRIAYGKADIPLNERAENFTSDNTAASRKNKKKPRSQQHLMMRLCRHLLLF